MASVLKQLTFLAVLGGLAYGGWTIWNERSATEARSGGRERAPAGVVVAEVVRDRIERSVSAIGKAEPLRSIALAPAAGGRVVEIVASGGEAVSVGDPVLRLDDDSEQSDMAEAQAELARAKAAFERATSLQAQGRVAQTTFEAAETELRTAEAAVSRARKSLDDRTLRAPYSGVIGFLSIDLGAIVEPGDTVAILDDISSLDVDFSVPERFFGEARAGAPIRATTEIFPGEVFGGEVTGIERRIDQVSRSFMARARVPNDGLRLPAGAFMRVTLVLEAGDGLLIPEEAVVAEGGETYVYVVEDGRSTRRAVTLGQRLPGRVAVTAGVAQGDLVITRGLQKARDGAPVNILSTEPAPAAAQS
jgi:membrane fusion protein (multidrug efflux system)